MIISNLTLKNFKTMKKEKKYFAETKIKNWEADVCTYWLALRSANPNGIALS